jgi:uncharacterized cysteine cluster protein YcgN (CxxCxxCC family)
MIKKSRGLCQGSNPKEVCQGKSHKLSFKPFNKYNISSNKSIKITSIICIQFLDFILALQVKIKCLMFNKIFRVKLSALTLMKTAIETVGWKPRILS